MTPDEEYDPVHTAEMLYGAVADDEGLRGDLDDDAYGPLLTWAAQRAEELAAEATSEIDALAEDLRDTVRSLVSAIESGEPGELATVDPAIISPDDAARLIEAIASAAEDPGARAAAVAHELSEPTA
jgi:hypothetical protein